MGVFDKVTSFFKKEETVTSGSLTELPLIFLDSNTTAAFKDYGINLASTKIANAISLCDFVEYSKGKVKKSNYWYRFNYQPNPNQNAAVFLAKIINQMITKLDGALVYQDKKGDLYVADSFTVEKSPFKENVYKNIYFEGKTKQGLELKESEVFRFVYNDSQAIKTINNVYPDYSDLMSGSIKNYNRSNAQKYKLKIGTTFDQFATIPVLDEEGKPKTRADGSVITQYDEILDDIFETRFKGVLSDKDSITPLEDGLDLDKLSEGKGNTKSGAATTRDITDIFKDIIYICSDPLSIPRSYMLGDVADAEAVKDDFNNNAVRPFIQIILKEINRKLYTMEQLINGNKIDIKIYGLSTRDPIKFANAAESYLRSGIYTINMLLEMIGEEPIEDDIGNKRFITKNYQTFEEMEQTEKDIKNSIKAALDKVLE